MSNKNLKILGTVYSVLSVIVLPFLLFLQLFSAFLFDSPGSEEMIMTYLIVLGIFLIPVILIISNIMMWIAIRKTNSKSAVIYMLIPIIYPIIFFLVWFGVDYISYQGGLN